MKKMKNFLLLIITILSLSACKTYSDEDKRNFDKQIKAYINQHNLKCKKSASGLYYKVIKEGKGNKIQISDNVSISYKGKLINYTTFDYQKKPVTFAVKDLIGGWKEMLLKSKPGAKIFMILPPHLGYGSNDLDDIPKNSILIFEMEIKSVE